ncbi:Serine/threonine-protein kinase [Exophiala xenobiotica]|uniref:non-specific serine/threonine protein kinase n=1 Tax=Vermiconidia calcicola TaxID=1690605 RepID=A0AAV9Q9U6_9PEZI|nr:Serine/threonine-protein kinase [Exophiala xenobiotica]KAK5538626.1 Serine/threonine-protein kinase [Vermiconidia calcicola]KAK5547885.1 Serine/threonine-protein kinase [Chaetothyriales sp. CCFEE 6169]KAK5305415.1 Serine/threonine-protein kinase [Exophiala xenobiotica]KAK5335760.1 Serine/threonine-protein kinase [Exophiala xenobiotica]
MATAASQQSPTMVRSHSASRNPPPSSFAPVSPAQPSRARSTNQRPSHHSGHNRSGSRSYENPPSSNPPTLVNVARRDFEQTNMAKTSSRRSSRDGRGDYSGESQGRASSRPGSRRGSQDLTAPTTVVANGSSAPPPPPASTAQNDRHASQAYPTVGRRRTSITAQTGTWSLGKTIGQGSMGKVKLARNAETGEQAAIKIVPRQTLDDHGNAKDERADRSKEIRTAREAAMVSLLSHPYICGMIDVQRTNYHWYMLFEYVNGGQMLDYIIAHGRLKEKQARKFGRQIASALDYCHRNSIVHRDLKIENILISKNGDIKIIDFGLSNLFSPRSLLKTFCGSLYFAAPELLQARQYTGPEVDVWSFGIVLYVLVCGKVPFDDQSMPQLHAKIKRGVVDYPQWLTAECKNIISRMLVVDPKERASLQEIMNHPWMIKGFNGPPDNYLPNREPLSLPLDAEVIEKMQGFDFGSAAYITEQLTRIIESDDYQSAIRRMTKDDHSHASGSGEKKRGVFDFYKRRNSISREGLTAPSSEAIRGHDALNAYSPLISIYYLAREKLERERREQNPGALAMPMTPKETPLKLPGLPTPEAAHTNTFAPEMPGEKATGGRSRPRARTNGEEDVVHGMKTLEILEKKPPPNASSPTAIPPPDQPSRKEGTAIGLLRRFSTRRYRERDSERPQPPPALNIQPPQDSAAPPRKSFSVRRSRRRDPSPGTHHAGGSQPQHEGLLSAGNNSSRAGKFLGRSTSVNSADYRPRRLLHRGPSANESPLLAPEPPPTSGSDKSSVSVGKNGKGVELTDKPAPNASPMATPRTPTSSRTKSLGHARQESIQARRRRYEERRDREANVPEETDADMRVGADALRTPAISDTPGTEISKPASLKGLFSTATTSSKPPEFIRHDIIRVLNQLGVQYTVIKGGFSCRHAPSINLEGVKEPGPGLEEERSGRVTSGHQRRISFGAAFRGKDREDVKDEKVSRHHTRRRQPDQSFVTNSEGSEDYLPQTRHINEPGQDMAATRTRVQDDTGERLVLKFEIAIVKIPLLSLHGIQFKKVQGGMNQYRSMTSAILNSLRL